MVLKEEPRYWFYPDVLKNLEQPESEQVCVEIIRPTGSQSKDFTTVESSCEYYKNEQPVDSNGNPRDVIKFKSLRTEVKINADYILRTCVGKVKNLKIQKDGEEYSIETGAQLAECSAYGINEIVSSICNEVKSDVPTDSKKKTSE